MSDAGGRKTLHITNAYHSSSGGIRTFYHALLRAADNRQRPMRLVVPSRVASEETVGRWGRIYHVQSRPAPAFDRRYRAMLPNAYLPPASSVLAQILTREQPALVEICDKYSLSYLAALIRKGWMPALTRPVLVGLSCERMDDNVRAYLGGGAIGGHLSRHYIRHIYGPPFDYHIANSEYTADELRRALWDRTADFVRVCPMGVEASRFGPQHRDLALRRELLARAGGHERSALILYVGRLAPEKRPELLLATLRRLVDSAAARGVDGRDYRLVVVGDGPARAGLQAEAARLVPGQTVFTGAVDDRRWLAACYASADVFVHPNAHEPFGIAPLEAMASGVPVVLPAAGGVLSYATRENAALAAPTATTYAEAITATLDQPCPARVAAARHTARTYDWTCVTAAWFDTYDRLIADAARPRRLAS